MCEAAPCWLIGVIGVAVGLVLGFAIGWLRGYVERRLDMDVHIQDPESWSQKSMERFYKDQQP